MVIITSRENFVESQMKALKLASDPSKVPLSGVRPDAQGGEKRSCLGNYLAGRHLSTGLTKRPAA
jgi:hypothetical protein